MKKIIHINQRRIRSNRKTGKREPVVTIKTWKGNDYASELLINGPCKLVYRPDKPLSCGATVWLECEGEVTVLS